MDHDDMDTMGESGMMDTDSFCQGAGRVMNPGFVFSFNPTARTEGNSCILWLFQDAIVDTAGKYAAALIGTFVMAFSLEILRASRGRMAKGRPPFEFMTLKASPLASDAILATTYVIQMTLAYWLMLLVMLYEAMVFVVIVVGLGTGYFVVLRVNRCIAQQQSTSKGEGDMAESDENRSCSKGCTPSSYGSIHDETCETNSPCCNTA
jgi:hypothetical protein